ncbi:ABC transporter ATP-binding protein [Phycicoccus sonneratiae]|uniref:ATP-binding cassette domain-containing protein n=1 Tax=Phycicoccus sonneratiae TaxID=2807628 RepID=A0ABS2CQ01_9MICO|nr:ATP-binding cassette domain-containing protein [Phycicoccus sonneraticus]MBM6401972.1 ATP-binding cassette domain-containing protein [Phycicoccus sonneraticus]
MTPLDQPAAATAEPWTDGVPRLAAHDLVVDQGATRAVDGVALELRAGERLAVTGASGSGKSTLLLALAGVLAPTSGRVDLDGTPLSTQGEAARARLRRTRFGIVFQYGQLIPDLTAVENVALPLLLLRRSRREALEAARAVLDELRVGDVADRRPVDMSGGQSQRVAIARALVTAPDVVLADEPTGSLDSVSGERVMATLLGAVRERGTTLVVVTHDATVAAYCDREVRLRDGRVVEAGSGR